MNRPADEDHIYAKFGRTAEIAQSLEIEAGTVFLAIVLIGVKTDEITDEERAYYRALVDDLNRRTLGDLLKQVRPLIDFDETVETQGVLASIDTALERRNYLMHRFFRNHNFRIFSEEGREIMSRDLDEIYRSLSIALGSLQGLSSIFGILGGREGVSEKLLQKALAQGKRIDI